jgi:phosphomannomutase
MSGHIFFKERWFGFDDGTYAGAGCWKSCRATRTPVRC